ncbi:MAG: type II toxin-antitoxin system HicA family toxin [Candidatus Obscuribacterales bacterium]|nr:type II toxin-antitoxin system HicA family toxin [Candidatus Obscuribacterales bacterium]
MTQIILFQEEGWYVAQAVKYDVCSQGNSAEEAKRNLTEALTLAQQDPACRQFLSPTEKSKQQSGNKSTFRQVRFLLEEAGFDEVKQLGDHAKFIKRENNEVRCAILPHYRELAASTVACILRQAGLSEN